MISSDSRDTWFDDLKIEITNRPTAVVVQENHYYPFGLGMKGLDYTAASPNRENGRSATVHLQWTDREGNEAEPPLARNGIPRVRPAVGEVSSDRPTGGLVHWD